MTSDVRQSTDALAEVTYAEILRQADDLAVTAARLADRPPPPVDGLVDAPLVFTGCGTSLYLAEYAAALLRSLTPADAVAAPASEVWLLPELTLRPGATLVAVSRSGSTSEILHAVEGARGRGVRTAGVTIDADSRLPAVADWSVHLDHVHEQGVVMTTSFANLLLALQWYVAAVAATVGADVDAWSPDALRGLADQVAGVLGELDAAARRATASGPQHLVYLGSGPMAAIAREGLLKMKETTQHNVAAYPTLEFRHGPISTVTDQTLAVLLSTPRTAGEDLAVAADIAALGGRVLVVGPSADAALPERVGRVPLPPGLPDWQYANLAVPFLQLLAVHETARLGLDPDRPRHLSRVVGLGATTS